MQKAVKQNIAKCGWGVIRACLFAFLSLVLYLLAGLFLSGCAKSVIVEKPTPYYLPQECFLSAPARPAKTQSIVTDVKNIVEFAEKAEAAALLCGAK